MGKKRKGEVYKIKKFLKKEGKDIRGMEELEETLGGRKISRRGFLAGALAAALGIGAIFGISSCKDYDGTIKTVSGQVIRLERDQPLKDTPYLTYVRKEKNGDVIFKLNRDVPAYGGVGHKKVHKKGEEIKITKDDYEILHD